MAQFEWCSEYDALARQFLDLHFRGGQGVTDTFPCMRGEYRWGKQRPPVIDSRVPAKNNTEYHGLENYASQYHATAQYEFAYHHWMMAAAWRRDDLAANDFTDNGHEKAVQYCVKQALYNHALWQWQASPTTAPPTPESFGLAHSDISKKELEASQAFEKHLGPR
jgi:hypothetical protein